MKIKETKINRLKNKSIMQAQYNALVKIQIYELRSLTKRGKLCRRTTSGKEVISRKEKQKKKNE